MSDPNTEKLIRVTDVPAEPWMPVGRNGRRVHKSSLVRWTRDGVRGIRLESILCGGSRYTSREAVFRFFAALNASNAAPPAQPAVPNNEAFRRAEEELDRAGI